MTIKEAQGYNKAEALNTTGLDIELDRLTNATIAWKKAGSPLSDKALKVFFENFIKSHKGVGAYIVQEPSVSDTRMRPYTVINEATAGKRKSTMVYQIKPAKVAVKYDDVQKVVVDKETGEEKVVTTKSPYKTELITVEVKDKETGEVTTKTKEIDVPQVKVANVGAVEGKASKKDEAFALAKSLVETYKQDYVIEIVKEISEGQKYAGYALYTPSKSAKLGKFVFCTTN
jgi:hypothetical protein